MVDPNCHGQGVGKSLGAHSLNTAREMGFRGIQFNIVISTNAAAVSLWKKLGFNIIGTTPNGYRHKTLGFVDTYIMYQAL
jgi:ribosomal protein S18 acetylase RimI-like enzyme